MRFHGDGPEQLAPAPFAANPPGAAEVQIAVHAFGLNFGDVLASRGLYPAMPPYPFTPGFEISGTVVAAGPGATLAPGTQVFGVTGPALGGHASRAVIPERLLRAKPQGVAHEAAAAFPVAFLTARHAFALADLAAGERVLVTSAAGGVGLAAVRLALEAGAEIFATAGAAEKRAALQAMGVRHVVDPATGDIAAVVRTLSGGAGMDVVVNSHGGAGAIQRGLDMLAPGGRYVELALVGLKATPRLDLTRFMGNESFLSVNLAALIAKGGPRLDAYLDEMAQRLAEDAPAPGHVVDWPDVAAAYRLLDERRNIGKVVVRLPAEPVAATAAAPEPAARGGDEPIAIVGFAGRFPGAGSVEAFWDNIDAGVCSVREAPADRWDAARFHDADRTRLDRTDCRHGGFVDAIGDFDAAFFSIAPKEARLADPQQRLFLETAWQALEHAGHGGEMSGARCGVYVGACGGDYAQRLEAAGEPRAPQSFWGNDDAVLAARISYHLDLSGPAVAVDTACSSSLVAIHLAAAALRAGECDSALAGGVFLRTTERFHILCSNAGMLSPRGECSAFGAAADGFVPGEGVGVLMLKRLADARADGDTVHAVIEGSAINQDGRTNGITAPSARGQAAVIRAALERAGVSATAIGLVEAHGTGTRLGDPIEVRALGEVYGAAGAAPGSVALGSVKSNIGHAGPAAGVAGVMKLLGAFARRTIPPTLHSEPENPLIAFAESPFALARSARPWPAPGGGRRRAAVSSFGFSGTNAHLVLAEPAAMPMAAARRGPFLFLLSARSEAALARRIADLRGWLADHPDARPGDVAATLHRGRTHFRWRAAVVASSLVQLAAALADAPSGEVPDTVDPALDAEADRLVAGGDPARLAALYRAGIVPPGEALHPDGSFRRVTLPTYPFERERYYVDAGPVAAPEPAPSTGGADKVAAVLAALAEVTGRPAAALRPVTPFDELGLDSLMIAQLQTELEPQFGPIGIDRFLSARTPVDLAAGLPETRAPAHPAHPASDGAPTEARVAEALADAAGIALADIDLDMPFEEYGLDPLTLARFGAAMPAGPGSDPLDGAAILAAGTPRRLAARLGAPAVHVRSEPLPTAAVAAPSGEPIAIVGIAGRYPGAPDLDAFWRRLASGETAIGPVPRSRWDAAADGVSLDAGAFLDGVELFDSHAFRMTPLEAKTLPPEERLMLEIAAEAMADAGLGPNGWAGREVAVYLGQTSHTFPLVAAGAGLAADGSTFRIANRLSATFDWTGPSLALDAACASSLLAIHLACEALAAGSCEAALAGGANLYLHPDKWRLMGEHRLLAAAVPDGLLSAGAGGFVPGEGVGAVLLKTLSRAIADGDRVQAVIRASAAGHKGRGAGFALPSPPAQAALLANLFARAGLRPEEIGRIELQAAGGEASDAAEWTALCEALGDVVTGEAGPAIGSLKGAIGHLEAASGIAAVTKAVLELAHGTFAPARIAATPHAGLRLGTPFVPGVATPWPERLPRRTLVTSAGAGGQAAALILEAPGDVPPGRPPRPRPEFERRRCWPLPEPVDAAPAIPAAVDGDVGAYYDAVAVGTAVEGEAFLTFAPFAKPLAGFSWLNAFFAPERCDPGHLAAMRQGQAALRRVLLRDVDPAAVRRVWDLGCGHGTDLLTLGRAHDGLAGVGHTLSPRQAALGNGRLAAAGLGSRLEIRVADSASTRPEGTFDLVIGFEVVVHVADKDGLVANVAAALAPGGALVLADVVAETAAEIAAPHLGQFTLNRAQYAALFARHGLAIAGGIDAGSEIARFLDDPAFEDNLAALSAARPEFAAVEAEHRGWHRFGRALGMGLMRYALLTVRHGSGDEAALTAQNLAALGALSPWPAEPAPAPQGDAAALERRLARIAADALETEPERLDPVARFAELGVDSLRALVLVEAINRALGTALPIGAIFAHSSLRDLARHLAPRLPQAPATAAPAAATPAVEDDAVAVIGVAGRFPGAADPAALWRLLSAGTSAVGPVPASRRGTCGAPHRRGGFLADVAGFDPLFFRLSPAEAAMIDPQQRLFLMAAWHALEDAAIAPDSLRGSRCGVFAGVLNGDYSDLIASGDRRGESRSQRMLGVANSILSARIAYHLDLAGPTMTLDTACSSSLVALHLACRSLAAGDCDLALAGGVTLYLGDEPFAVMEDAGMLSPAGACRPFDAAADGIVPGEAVAVAVLKRHADAVRDGDPVLGLVRATGINGDGRTNGITAPNGAAQAALVDAVWRRAGISPADCGLLEAHGTGTRLGDPIEFAALAEVLGRHGAAAGGTALGAAKAALGHTSAAAGMVGLIAVLAALRHRTIPPVALLAGRTRSSATARPLRCGSGALPSRGRRRPAGRVARGSARSASPAPMRTRWWRKRRRFRSQRRMPGRRRCSRSPPARPQRSGRWWRGFSPMSAPKPLRSPISPRRSSSAARSSRSAPSSSPGTRQASSRRSSTIPPPRHWAKAPPPGSPAPSLPASLWTGSGTAPRAGAGGGSPACQATPSPPTRAGSPRSLRRA